MNQEEIYDKMDEISQIALINIYTLSKNENTINLRNLDVNNKEHLFLFKIADILGMTIEKELTVDCGFWQRMKLKKIVKRKIKKEILENGINTPEVLDFMRPRLKELFPDGNTDFGMVYEALYERRS